MKKIFQFILLLSLLIAGACKENNMDPLGEFEISSPTLTAPADGSTVVLHQHSPDSVITFTWEPSEASNKFIVQYTVVLDSADNTEFSTPILTLTPANSGRAVSVTVKAKQIDHALSLLNYPANSTVPLRWAVIANATTKSVVSSASVSIQRFATEEMPDALYISGSATETGTDVTKATPMRSQKNSSGTLTHIYDVYTKLTAGGTYKFYSEQGTPSLTYGGSNGSIVKGGAPITVATTGVYRVTVDLNTNKYTLLAIDHWSVVGDGSPVGWGGDAPLTYQGGGVWSASMDLVNAPTGSFIFRANGDWGYIMKRIVHTTNQVFMESEAPGAGLSVENEPVAANGTFIITLNLAAGQYNYTIEKDPNAPASLTTPDDLYLLQGSTVISHLTKDGDKFTSAYLALTSDKTYKLNSKSDGSGTSYTVTQAFGTSDNPAADNVNSNTALSEGSGDITVSTSQAYKVTVDFSAAKLSWQYYNLKMFHWDDPGGGWDARNEYVMTYVDPYTFTVTAAITANYDIKFNSPWDVQFGASSGGLTGTMTNGGANFTGITQSGTYKATIVVSNDYTTCTYTFVKQ